MTLKEAIKKIIVGIRQTQRVKEIKRAGPRITKERIVEDLKKLGLKEGDNVLLHSSLKSIGYVKGGARTVIQAVVDVISPSGTLIVPTYSLKGTMYATCKTKNYIFDPHSSPTGLGNIPATFLNFHNKYRSIHPTHSVSAIGKNAKFITEAHHQASSTFGADSPWDRLMKLNGKVMALGVTIWPIPLVHVLEDRELDKFPLPVRMKKTYILKCKDWTGNLIEVPVTPLDPKYIKIRIDQETRQDLKDHFWQEFIQAGIVNVGNVGQATAWIASANGFYKHCYTLMKEGITIYSSIEELQRRPLSTVTTH